MTRFFVISALCLTFIGCKPSPEKVCNHLKEIADKENAKDFAVNGCIDDLNKGMKDKPAQSECLMKCLVDAVASKDVETCDKSCK